MLGVMGTSAAFAQAAGRAGKGAQMGKIILDTQNADPTIASISCTGEIKVSSIKNGAPLVQTYSDLSGETLSIQADANTQIVISGAEITACEIGSNVNYTKISVENTALTYLNCNICSALTALDISGATALIQLDCSECALTALDLSKNTALTTLYCNDCSALTALDISGATALTDLSCERCTALTALDISGAIALTEFSCNECSELTALDLSKNTALTMLSCSDCAKLVSISYPATNEDVSTAIATAITNADAADGTVYTDSAAAYYSTIETAATAKGWTIEQIPA